MNILITGNRGFFGARIESACREIHTVHGIDKDDVEWMPVNPNILWNAVQIAARGVRTPVPTNEYRGHTYVYDMIEQVLKVPEIPYSTYHIGSRNELGSYDMVCHALRVMGLADRVDKLVEPDSRKYAQRPRDVRLSTDRIRQYGITFQDSAESVTRCLGEFHLKDAFG